jgi:hypothetical protein
LPITPSRTSVRNPATLAANRAHDAVTAVDRAERLRQVDRAVDLNRAGEGIGVLAARVEVCVVSVDSGLVELPAVPAEVVLLVKLVEGIRAGGVNYREPRNASNQSEFREFGESLREARRVAEIAARHDNPIRHLPPQRFQHAEHDRLLPFQPEGVHAVHEVNAELPTHFLHAAEGVVEVSES